MDMFQDKGCRVTLDGVEYDPFKVLCIGDRNAFTRDELKQKYKSLALQLHPDKNKLGPDASKHVFQILTACYKSLSAEADRRQADKPFYELRTQAMEQQEKQAQAPPPLAASSISEKFDANKFNRVFAEHRQKTIYDDGYGDWMSRYDPEDPATRAAMKEEQKRREMRVVKWSDPTALHVVRSRGMGFEELGVDRIDDFSMDPAAADRKRLVFTDYRVAHSTTQIVDPELVKQRKEYKNVQELESDRANLRYDMSASDRRKYDTIKRKTDATEQRRAETLKRFDVDAERHYQRVHQLLVTDAA